MPVTLNINGRRYLQSLGIVALAGFACLVMGLGPTQVAGAPPAAVASTADAPVSELADPQALLQIRIEKPLRILDNPWLRQVWPLLDGSPTMRNLEPGVTGRLEETRRFLERTSEIHWRDALDKLTAGGIEISLQKRAEADPRMKDLHPFASLVVIQAADEKLLAKFLAAADRERREQAAARAKETAPDSSPAPQVTQYTYHGQNCTKVVKGADQPGEYFAGVGRRFLFANDEKVLEQAIDRSLEKKDREKKDAAKSEKETAAATDLLVRFALRLDLLREFPQFRELLQQPASSPWIAPFVGTWDSVRRSDRVAGSLQLEQTGLRLRVRSAGTAGMPAGLRAAITPPPKDPLLPSLQIPSSVCALNLYRDVEQLWQNRNDWLSSDGVKEVEEWNRLPQAQIPDLNFLKALPYLGPHWRLALALPAQVERWKRRDLLPAFAVVVDLRDEASFRREVLDRLETYLKSDAVKKHGRLETWTHHGTQASQFHWNPPAFPPGFRNPRGGPRPEQKAGDGKVTDAKPIDGDVKDPQHPVAAAVDFKAENAKPADPKLGGKPDDRKFGDGKANRGRPPGVAGGRTFRGGHRNWQHRSGVSMFRHMHPAFAIRNGQLIVGSNGEITRQAIEELERQGQTAGAVQAASTVSGEQFLSLQRLAEHLTSRERTLTWRLIRSGIPEDQAKQELATLSSILTELGDVTYRETATDASLQIEVHVGKSNR